MNSFPTVFRELLLNGLKISLHIFTYHILYFGRETAYCSGSGKLGNISRKYPGSGEAGAALQVSQFPVLARLSEYPSDLN